MKSKKKSLLITIIILILVISLGLFLYFYFTNPNRLTSKEKRFLAENSSVVQNIGILNNVNLFGNSGAGVFYDFLDDFSKEHDLKLNPVTYNLGETAKGLSFTAGTNVADTEFVFYEEHFVLVGKKQEYISNASHLTTQRIGVLKEYLSHVQEYLNNGSVKLQSYETRQELLDALQKQTDVDYMIVPLSLYMDEILAKDYSIVSHFSDMPYYYKINMGDNVLLGTILQKYFNTWNEKHFHDSYKDHMFNLFIGSLGIQLKDVDAMRAVSYEYGFINNSPYEILSGGNYGGVIAQYLKEFSDFSDIELKFTKYKSLTKFQNAIKNNKVNIYFGYYDVDANFNTVHSGIGLSYSVLVSKKNPMVIHSLNALKGEEVYVLKDSTLYNYLKTNLNAVIKTYETEKELEKLIKNDEIIIVDSNVYAANQHGMYHDYTVRYSSVLDTDYNFRISTNETFSKLFTKFVNMKDSHVTINKGIYNYDLTFKAGTITGTIARYFMYILIAFVLIFLYVYRVTKKVKLTKKIKKEDKLKYIDQLTSLKNRNYLTENLEVWSQNRVYPQSVIVIDLNNLQYINDTMGYEKGDEQIKAAANILVKTQLDNSDIIRTDGNEFVLYLVGYQTKQITSYIHKLNKEFKRLPYEQGAAIGYSMIEDDIKTIEDAINEAVEEVKKQKENKKEEK